MRRRSGRRALVPDTRSLSDQRGTSGHTRSASHKRRRRQGRTSARASFATRREAKCLARQDKMGSAITYKQYDVAPHRKGVGRGTERLVVGSHGRAYYATDHLGTFVGVE